MDIVLLGIIIFLSLVFIFLYFYLYNIVAINSQYVVELSKLVTRTFKEYYKGQDIEPIVVNNGIELVWKGDSEEDFVADSSDIGFISICVDDGTVHSPIKNHKEADILAGKIMNIVYEYIQDKEN